jgi:hypothetical protein
VGEKQEVELEIIFFYKTNWNPKFIYTTGGKMMTMVCPCKSNGQNKDTEMGTGI